MSQIIDSLIVFRILHILLQPIEKTDAFKLGLVDKNGKQLKNPNTSKERDAYTILNKVAFKLKSILKKVSGSEKDLKALATSIHMVKECYTMNYIPDNLEELYTVALESVDEADVAMVRSILSEDVKTFKQFSEEGEAPANNTSVTQGVDGFTPETVPVKKTKLLRRRKTNC